MLRHVMLEKKKGETPLQALDGWRAEHPEYATVPASYAGRLDPMASGKLLILLGDECKKQERYTRLDKEYEVELLLDLSSDTGDVLGMPLAGDRSAPQSNEIYHAIQQMLGTHVIPYPIFSSKTVAGKPLFLYALEGTLDTIEIPVHEETIYRITGVAQQSVSRDILRTRIEGILAHAPRTTEPSKELGADFRQDAIRSKWSELFDTMPEHEFIILSLRVTCASGTYMRTLASRLASALGTTGLALSIHRTRIGRWVNIGPLRFWFPSYY